MNIPTDPSVSYIAILLFLIGLFLFISGLNIITVEKITVSRGYKTWLIGLFLMAGGAILGFQKTSEDQNQEISGSSDKKKPSPSVTLYAGSNPPKNDSYDTKKNSSTELKEIRVNSSNENTNKDNKKLTSKQLKELLKEISNNKFTTQLFDRTMNILGNSESSDFYLIYSDIRLKTATTLKRYGLIDYHIKTGNNITGYKKKIQLKLLALGEVIFSNILNVVYEINYNSELSTYSTSNKDIKYPGIKTSLDGLTNKQIKYFILHSPQCAYSPRKSEHLLDMDIYFKKGLFEYYELGHKCYSSTKNFRSYGLTPMGKEVTRQVYDILYEKLLYSTIE